MTDIAIRPATAADLESIATLERDVFADPWSLASFDEALRSDACRFLVAVSASGRGPRGAIAGYAVGACIVPEASVDSIAVRADQRGAGLGSRLLDALLRALACGGATTAFLEVRVSNVAALRLYEQRGFVLNRRRRGYYSRPVEDGLELRLDLSGA